MQFTHAHPCKFLCASGHTNYIATNRQTNRQHTDIEAYELNWPRGLLRGKCGNVDFDTSNEALWCTECNTIKSSPFHSTVWRRKKLVSTQKREFQLQNLTVLKLRDPHLHIIPTCSSWVGHFVSKYVSLLVRVFPHLFTFLTWPFPDWSQVVAGDSHSSPLKLVQIPHCPRHSWHSNSN